MAGTTMTAFAALTTGVILSAGNDQFAEHAGLSALTAALLFASLILCVLAAYRAATEADATPRADSLESKVSRRTTGPRERRV